ncbi:histone deacetylase [Bacteroidota bacterium]|jgi:acetoin utilization deacetylase AcuC-like enzyme|nr:histone deacetylase [Bacteroidota bacterium]MDC3297134.1 histone deacetylase [Balneolaceae bacterium]
MIKVAWHPSYVHPVPDGHRFPMEKYELLPMRLIREGIVSEDNFFEPSQGLTYNLDVHDSEYLRRLFNLELTKKEVRASGFTLSQELIQRELRITNGTVEGALWALNNRSAAFNIAGGTHHASANKAEGFCLLNDQAIASSYLLENTKVSQILIIDLDVHQGNGTAQIFKNINNVYTFSMHGANNYPYHKPPSDLDIPLPDNTDDKKYLSLLKKYLPNIMTEINPDFIFYLAGVDVLAEDKLGRLGLTLNGCTERDELVFALAKDNDIPIMTTMGGGYAPDIKIILEAHCNTFRSASDVFY